MRHADYHQVIYWFTYRFRGIF